MAQRAVRLAVAMAAAAVLLTSCRHKYENPIATPTEQPDKVLFDKAIDSLEHNRFASARLLLNTLINTYDSSEFLAKAKLAVADSWFREGDAHGLAQAEAEYKDFILFYPTMEEAAEAQERVCRIHYNQMDKADRDPVHVIRAEEECRNVLIQYPNSKFAPEAEQLLRNIQENRAMAEYKVGQFYMTKGNSVAAANRLNAIPEQFPLFSKADDAAWLSYQSWNRLGDRFEKQQIEELSKVVRDYPLSAHVDLAKEKLQEMNAPIPDPDPEAEARMKYELQNRGHIGLWSSFWGGFSSNPNLALAARSGAPSMQSFQPTTPASVPAVAAGLAPSGEVTVSTPTNPASLESAPDARTIPPSGSDNTAAPGAPAGGAAGGAAAAGAASGPASGVTAGAAAPAAAPQKGTPSQQKNQKQAKAPKPPKPPKAPKQPAKKNAKPTPNTPVPATQQTDRTPAPAPAPPPQQP